MSDERVSAEKAPKKENQASELDVLVCVARAEDGIAVIIREAVWRCGGSQEEASALLGTTPETAAAERRKPELGERAEMPNGELK